MISNSLPPIERQNIEGAIGLISNCMNAVQVHFEDCETYYNDIAIPNGDGDVLLHYLKELKGYKKACGEIIWQDSHGNWNVERIPESTDQ